MTTQHAKSNAREGDGVAEQVSALSRLHARLVRQLEADALLGDMAHSLRSAAEISALSKAIYAMQAQQGAEPLGYANPHEYEAFTSGQDHTFVVYRYGAHGKDAAIYAAPATGAPR